MEAINNVATVAAKAVWGSGDTHNEEPVSGVNGDVAKGEPYDAGNLDPEEQKRVESRLSGDHKDADSKKDASATEGDATAAAQSDTRGPDDVETPVNPTGPGPRPLVEVAREHGGDAGRDSPVTGAAATTDAKPDTSSKDELATTEAAGTGEQHVKATGLAADGGDFDATKPGAGKEADRLLEQKGVQHDVGPSAAADKTTTESETSSPKAGKSKNRLSLSERIKAKFHRR